ncbi:MAG: exodeoxyribonuclease III [Acidimicrobiales bacterium]
MRVATWNVNSLKVRMPRVEQWLAEVSPDIVCLQETKLADDAFPALTFAGLGYETAHRGQGQWNGVAVLSKLGVSDVVDEFADGAEADAEARLLTVTCGGIRVTSVYVPNGRALDHDHYRYKLDWLRRLRDHITATGDPSQPLIVAGDFNIAPADIDVWDPKAFEAATHVSPPEREALASITAWGLRDVFRELHTDPKLFSWWDYRAGDFHEGRGMRIDLMLLSSPLADRVRWAIIDRNARKGKLPSDHAPVVIDVDI